MPRQRPLTPRQHVILRSIASGATNKEIALALGISEQGVKVHISRLLDRYGAENRVELINVTRAWAAADEQAYSTLSADPDGIREELGRGFSHAASVGDMRAARSRSGAGVLRSGGALSPGAPAELIAAVTSLREVLNEVNVAVKLSGELPGHAATGPLVDAIRTRVRSALDQSERLAGLIERQQQSESEQARPRESAS